MPAVWAIPPRAPASPHPTQPRPPIEPLELLRSLAYGRHPASPRVDESEGAFAGDDEPRWSPLLARDRREHSPSKRERALQKTDWGVRLTLQRRSYRPSQVDRDQCARRQTRPQLAPSSLAKTSWAIGAHVRIAPNLTPTPGAQRGIRSISSKLRRDCDQ